MMIVGQNMWWRTGNLSLWIDGVHLSSRFSLKWSFDDGCWLSRNT